MSDTQFDNSRLMSDTPHTDGFIVVGAENLAKDSANLVLTRNAAGDWSLNRTAGGAETYNVRANLADIIRTGERFDFGNFGITEPLATAKGIKITDAFAIYTVGVVDLTTATLRLGRTVYANNAAIAQTDLIAAAAVPKVVQANPYVSKLSVVTPGFTVNDTCIVEAELVIVMANTGTIKIAGVGFHFAFNYT